MIPFSVTKYVDGEKFDFVAHWFQPEYYQIRAQPENPSLIPLCRVVEFHWRDIPEHLELRVGLALDDGPIEFDYHRSPPDVYFNYLDEEVTVSEPFFRAYFDAYSEARTEAKAVISTDSK